MAPDRSTRESLRPTTSRADLFAFRDASDLDPSRSYDALGQNGLLPTGNEHSETVVCFE